MWVLFPPSEVSAYFLRQDAGQGYFYINEDERKIIYVCICVNPDSHYSIILK